MKWTVLLSTEPVTILVLVTQHILEAPSAHHFLGWPASNPLCRLAPINNTSLAIAYVNAVAQRVEDYV
jgi:hypothetical protein